MKLSGTLKGSTKEYFRGAVKDLAKVGCDGVVMACTEIPLILGQEDVDLPLLDSTRLLANAALQEALNEDADKNIADKKIRTTKPTPAS